MNEHDQCLERAHRLRMALLHEWIRLKLDCSQAKPNSLERQKLAAHVEVIAKVLRDDEEALLAMMDAGMLPALNATSTEEGP